jgi:hypothetical protein
MPNNDDLSPLLETAKRIWMSAANARLAFLQGNQDGAEVCLDAICRLSRQLSSDETDARRAVRREKDAETVQLIATEDCQ